MATYISTFNEHAAQVEWNEPSLMARFRAGLKDDLLDSIATARLSLALSRNGCLWLQELTIDYGRDNNTDDLRDLLRHHENMLHDPGHLRRQLVPLPWN